MSNEKWAQYNDIQFDGNSHSKNSAIELLDSVLREQGNFNVYGDLSGGVEALVKEMNIQIENKNDRYSIYLSPKNTSGGHDFSFTIDRKTEKIFDVVVGEVLPEPNIDY